MSGDKRAELFPTLVYLADTLVQGFDVLDLADRLVEASIDLLGALAAGIMLDDQHGSLRVLASSDEQTRLLELLEVQNDEGPCLEAFRSGQMVAANDLSRAAARWPRFVAEATHQEIGAAYAVPMRLRDKTIGALNLFCATGESLSSDDLEVGHLLASIATIGIINHRTIRQQEQLAEQLQTALNSRIIIEQAKGVIAERAKINMGAAFDLLRSAARSSRRPISEVAREVAEGNLPDAVASAVQARAGTTDER